MGYLIIAAIAAAVSVACLYIGSWAGARRERIETQEAIRNNAGQMDKIRFLALKDPNDYKLIDARFFKGPLKRNYQEWLSGKRAVRKEGKRLSIHKSGGMEANTRNPH